MKALFSSMKRKASSSSPLPVLLSRARLGTPLAKEAILRAVAKRNPQRPLFVPAYGVENYVDMAQAMHERLSAHGFVVVGTQDLATLGRKAAPSAPKTDDTTFPDQPATTPRFNRVVSSLFCRGLV